MTLDDLGYNEFLEQNRNNSSFVSFGLGRVISEHKERFMVKTTENEYDAEIIGNLRFTAQHRSDFPAVGDWVAISEFDENKVLIHHIYPRKTIIERQSVGKHGEKQIIASNIDFAFIVQSVDHDFNINRIERYLTICNASKVKPIIILNKIDLISDAALVSLMASIQQRIKDIPVIAISNESKSGIEQLKSKLTKGNTYCLLGSSGVGKSSLLNNLLGQQQMKTGSISTSTNKGRHVTSHRELLVLETGGIIIDNPGMREVGITDSTGGLEITFDAIIQLSKNCKFKDCTHTSEINCAVLSAINTGELSQSAYENYLKLEKEKAHFESTIVEKHKKDKDFGKMVKHFKNAKKSNKL